MLNHSLCTAKALLTKQTLHSHTLHILVRIFVLPSFTIRPNIEPISAALRAQVVVFSWRRAGGMLHHSRAGNPLCRIGK